MDADGTASCNSGIEIVEGASATGACEKLIVFGASDFSGAGTLFGVSKWGITGGAGVIVDAAGCTCSCRPIEMNDGSGLAGETACGAATGGFTAVENEAASAGFSVIALAGGAGAQEISDADGTGIFLMAGAAGSTAAGCAGLFAIAGPSDGK